VSQFKNVLKTKITLRVFFARMFHRAAAKKGCNRCALSSTFVAGKFIREAVDNLRQSNRYLSNQGKIAGEGSKHLNETAPSAKRGPVSWTNLSLVAVASAAAVGYFKVQRERRLEEAVGKIVTSESDGWTPDKENFAPRKFYQTEDGKWFPKTDQWGGCESAQEFLPFDFSVETLISLHALIFFPYLFHLLEYMKLASQPLVAHGHS